MDKRLEGSSTRANELAPPPHWSCIQQEDGTFLVDPGRSPIRVSTGQALLLIGSLCLLIVCMVLYNSWFSSIRSQEQKMASVLVTLVALTGAFACFYGAVTLLLSQRIWRLGHHFFEEEHIFRGRSRKKRYKARAWLIQTIPISKGNYITQYSLEMVGVSAPDIVFYLDQSRERCEACGRWLAFVTGWPLVDKILALDVDN